MPSASSTSYRRAVVLMLERERACDKYAGALKFITSTFRRRPPRSADEVTPLHTYAGGGQEGASMIISYHLR